MTPEQIAAYLDANATAIAKGRALAAAWPPPSQRVVNACAAILAPWQQAPRSAAA